MSTIKNVIMVCLIVLGQILNSPRVVKGMRDILPADVLLWQKIENTLIETVAQFAYQEIRTPVLESLALFNRSVGELTDIVEKEMYSFSDQSEEILCLRPEGTASTVRAVLNHNLLNQNLPHRLWYLGPMFRRERPQKGRYRQFFHFGVEAFGLAGPDIDIEQILLTYTFWKQLKITDHLVLEVNTLGDATARAEYREVLISYYKSHYDSLDEDSKRRLERNPLRILDSKNESMIELNQNAPKLIDFISEDCREHFDTFCEHLDALAIPYQINPCLVRGIDYYTRTVFEWTTDKLGAQSTVCAGGHYDGLVESWGGPDTPACGFAIGLDRLLLLWQSIHQEDPVKTVHLYWVAVDKAAKQYAWKAAQDLRERFRHLVIIVDCDGAKFKQQFKRADRAGALLACVVGEDELQQNKITIKYLQENKPQTLVTFSELEIICRAFRTKPIFDAE